MKVFLIVVVCLVILVRLVFWGMPQLTLPMAIIFGALILAEGRRC